MYLYGYPLVTMDMTRKRLTNVAVPDESHAPVNQLLKLRTYPAVDNHAVTAPNPDTLYTMAWLDVSHEPWVVSVYGTDYLQRAMITAFGLGANIPQDAIYPAGMKDADGKELDAASNKYVIHFDKGQTPPVRGFWSLTMYDKDFFFVPNSLHRQTLSQRDKLITNPDGSVDLYLQAESPGKAKEVNWLPAPKAKFVPIIRLYWPNDTPPSIIDGTWKPPAIKVAQ